MKDLSVVVPVYNEQDNLRPLVREIMDALTPLGLTWEILLVDDGSRDGTGSIDDVAGFIALRDLTAAQVAKAAKTGGTLVARVHAVAKDGGPACAAVPLLGGGWTLEL
mgnify:CR=1 FL=1